MEHRYKILVTIVFVYLFCFVPNAKAADFEIICDNNGCSEFAGPVFTEAGVLPGDGVSRSIEVINNSDDPLQTSFELTKNDDTDDNFVDVVELTIEHDASNLYDDVFSNVFDDLFELGEIGSGVSTEVTLDLFLPTMAGNEYQNNIADFDITFYFEGGDEEEPQVISTNTTNNSNNEETSEDQGQVLGTTDDESLMDKVLGLSNTSSGRKFLGSALVGFILFLIGASFILKSLTSKKIT